MAAPLIQPSFAAGEISPTLYARVDLAKYHTGAALIRNAFADYRGGATSRGGTKFIGQAKISSKPARLLPFQFNTQQTYVLEFGDAYMRVITNGGYILETAKNVTAITQANPGVVTITSHGYSNGDWVVASGIGGMTLLNGRSFIVAGATTNTFQLTDPNGANVNTTSYPAFTSGGTFARIYTVVSPYAAADLQLLKYIQSADTMTLTHPSYPTYNLTRATNTNWSFTATNFGSAQAAPVAVSAVPSVTTPTPLAQFSYVVTAVNATTGSESIASNIVTCSSVDISQTAGSITITWHAASGAGSYNIYKAPVGYDTTFTPVGALYGIIGSTTGLQFTDGNITADQTRTPPLHLNPFAVSPITNVVPTAAGTLYTQATVGYTISTSTGSGFVGVPVIVSGGLSGFIILNQGQNYAVGDTITITDSGTGSGATATLTIGASTGTYPGCAAYFQQRLYFADSTNQPDTFWATKVGQYSNMDSANPPQPNDSITDTISAQQVNGIQFMVPMPGGLVVLTGLGAWQLTGGGQQTAVTPQDAEATPQAYNGCHPHVPPLTINYDILYVQEKGSIVRDLAYNFFVNIYTGTDLTILSNHLFLRHQIQEWAWCEEPFKIVWAVRDDGVLLCLTYLKEQEVYAWTHSDTFGLFMSVCSVSEGINTTQAVNAPYFVVKRLINGNWVQYIERMDNRLWNTVEDVWAVDAGLQTALTYPNATLTPAAATGSSVVFTASASVFSSGSVGQIIRIGGGIATVTGYTSGTQVTCSITQPITSVLLNGPTLVPIPQISGAWSIAPQITVINGLNHLEGCTVAILADGSVQTPQVVSGGAITLQYAASLVTVGLPFQGQVQSLPVDSGNPTIQGKRKNIPALSVRVASTRGLKMGRTFATCTEFKERGNDVFAGTAIPLYTGDQRQVLDALWDVPGQVCIQMDYPLPFSVLGIIPEINVGDTNAEATGH